MQQQAEESNTLKQNNLAMFRPYEPSIHHVQLYFQVGHPKLSPLLRLNHVTSLEGEDRWSPPLSNWLSSVHFRGLEFNENSWGIPSRTISVYWSLQINTYTEKNTNISSLGFIPWFCLWFSLWLPMVNSGCKVVKSPFLDSLRSWKLASQTISLHWGLQI